MKKIAFSAAVLALTFGLSPEITASPPSAVAIQAAQTVQTELKNNLTPFASSETEDPQPKNSPGKPYFQFDWGAAATWLTRIVYQTERSNFVFRDFLAGLYFCAELHNIKYVTPMIRVAAYYPLVFTFNQMPQKPKTPLHFGADFFAGVSFGGNPTKFLRLSAGPGLHLFFLNSDRWNYLNMGGAIFAGIEFFLNPKWSLLVNGFASLDSGNLGSNRLMEPFDMAYQYQVDFGFRYSKKRSDFHSVLNR